VGEGPGGRRRPACTAPLASAGCRPPSLAPRCGRGWGCFEAGGPGAGRPRPCPRGPPPSGTAGPRLRSLRRPLAAAAAVAAPAGCRLRSPLPGPSWRRRPAGLMVLERNWLDVYTPWGTWGGNANLPTFQQGQVFEPTELTLREGATQPPPRLSERDLISAMERYGIGAPCPPHRRPRTCPALAASVRRGAQCLGRVALLRGSCLLRAALQLQLQDPGEGNRRIIQPSNGCTLPATPGPEATGHAPGTCAPAPSGPPAAPLCPQARTPPWRSTSRSRSSGATPARIRAPSPSGPPSWARR
jgi:hypothetical protein